MKNLRTYESLTTGINEAVAPKKLGFAISILSWGVSDASHWLVIGVADTFHEFAESFMRDFAGMDPEDLEEEVGYTQDIETLIDTYLSVTDNMDVSGSGFEYVFWSDLEPKSNSDVYDSISLDNPIKASVLLNKYFRNAGVVMSEFVQGTENDDYIARSIENDPTKLHLYDEEMQKKIAKTLNWDKNKLDTIMNVNRIKDHL